MVFEVAARSVFGLRGEGLGWCRRCIDRCCGEPGEDVGGRGSGRPSIHSSCLFGQRGPDNSDDGLAVRQFAGIASVCFWYEIGVA